MPTIIDSLVVTLGFDTTKLKSGQQESRDALGKVRQDAEDAALSVKKQNATVADTAGKAAKANTTQAAAQQQNNKKVSDSFKSMRNEVLGYAAAYLGASKLIQMAGALTVTGAANGRAAFQMGMDVTQLTAWANAMESIGGSAQAAQQSIAQLVQDQQALRFGDVRPDMQLLEQLGVNPNQNPVDIYKSLASNKRLQGMSPQQRDYWLSQIVSDPTTRYAIEKGPGYLNTLLAQQGDKGNETPAQAKALQDLLTSENNVKQAFDQLGLNLLTGLAPAIEKTATGLTNFINWLDNKFPSAAGQGVQALLNSTGVPTAQSQKDVKAAGLSFFMGKGLSLEQASGIMANVQAESSYNPAAGKGTAHQGLFQWDAKRWAKLTGKYGAAPTAEQQYQFAWDELNSDYSGTLSKLKGVKTSPGAPGTAASIFNEGYEKPGDYLVTDVWRAILAQNIAATYTGTGSKGVPPSAQNVLNAIHRTRPGGPGAHGNITKIENNITVHAHSGDAKVIAKTIVSKLAQHQGLTAQLGGSLN